MKIGMTCFTTRGAGICRLLRGWFRGTRTERRGYVPQRFWKPEWEMEGILLQDRSLSEWTGPMFGRKRALVFIGAVGVTVRTIAPYVRDKMTGLPVVAADEAGRFCIPLLLGYVRGANELAEKMVDWPSGIPVITTVVDVSGTFAMDTFAARSGLRIIDRKEAKEISIWLLDGGEVGFFCDSECHGAEGAKNIYKHNICMNRVCGHNIWIILRNSERPSFLRLVLKMVVVGMSCRKRTPPNVLKCRVLEALEDSGINPAAIKALSTIDVKAGEVVMSQLADRYGWELCTFTAGGLLAVEGEFEESEFVGTVMDVGDVRERSCTAGGGTLLVYKRTGEGMAVAAAIGPVARADHSQ